MKARRDWFINVPWGKLALVGHGHPDGEPVFVVHGRQDSSSVFEPLIELMSEEYYYVALDMPGNGLSDAFPPAPCSLRDGEPNYAVIYNEPPIFRNTFENIDSSRALLYAQCKPRSGPKLMRFHYLAAMEFAIKHLGWDKFMFVGHSMGCEQGLFYSAVHPGAITKMILLDAGPTLMRLQVDDHFEYQSLYDSYYDNYTTENFDRKEYNRKKAIQALQRHRDLTEEQCDIILQRNFHVFPFTELPGNPRNPIVSEKHESQSSTSSHRVRFHDQEESSNRAQSSREPTSHQDSMKYVSEYTPELIEHPLVRILDPKLDFGNEHEIVCANKAGIHIEERLSDGAKTNGSGSSNVPQNVTCTERKRSRKRIYKKTRQMPVLRDDSLMWSRRNSSNGKRNENETQKASVSRTENTTEQNVEEAPSRTENTTEQNDEEAPGTSANQSVDEQYAEEEPGTSGNKDTKQNAVASPENEAPISRGHGDLIEFIQSLRDENAIGYLSWDSRLKTLAPQNYGNDYYFQLFKTIPPTLLIAASDGAKNVPPNPKWRRGVKELLDRMATLDNFHRVDVEGSHDVHFTHPERVLPYVNAFLRGNRLSSKL